jgi:hypothetical protein
MNPDFNYDYDTLSGIMKEFNKITFKNVKEEQYKKKKYDVSISWEGLNYHLDIPDSPVERIRRNYPLPKIAPVQPVPIMKNKYFIAIVNNSEPISAPLDYTVVRWPKEHRNLFAIKIDEIIIYESGNLNMPDEEYEKSMKELFHRLLTLTCSPRSRIQDDTWKNFFKNTFPEYFHRQELIHP